MNSKAQIRKLKKELNELQGNNNIIDYDFHHQRMHEGTKILSSVFFIVTGIGSFVLLGVCWNQLAPLLESHIDFRPFILCYAIAALIIGIYQNVSARNGAEKLASQQTQRHRRIMEIKNQIIDLEN